jgi:hypothetical protein
LVVPGQVGCGGGVAGMQGIDRSHHEVRFAIVRELGRPVLKNLVGVVVVTLQERGVGEGLQLSKNEITATLNE